MTASINANTTTGVVVTSDTSGSLALQTANTTALTINSSQNVGIGTSSPSTALDVASSNSGITLTNTAVSNKKWRLGGNSSGYFQITETGIADRLTIDTSGNVNISTSNAGIVFNNSSALTNSTLNDYETGTFTVTDGSGAGLTFTANTGYYTKVGRLVTISMDFNYPTTSSTANARITLPFTAVTGGPAGGGAITYVTVAGGITAYLGGTTFFSMYSIGGGASITNVNLSGKELGVVFTYHANF